MLFKKPPRYEQQSSKPGQAAKQNDQGLAQLKETGLDFDNDGLKDWEEKLWGTDPNKADTDGDGASDGEELRQNRDPLKAGPDDKLLQPKTGEIKPETISEGENLTERLTADTIRDYFSKKQAGAKPEASSELIGNILKSEGEVLKDEFTKNDFNKFAGVTKEERKEYLNRLGEILKNNFKDVKGNELEVLFKILESGNEEELKKFDVYLSSYRKTVADLKNLAAPEEKDYLNLHLLLINIMRNLEKSVEAMKLAFSDPLKMIFGARWYLNEAERWQKFEEDFEVLTIKDGIVFEKNEGGSFILK